MDQIIIHVDIDNFFAEPENRRDAEMKKILDALQTRYRLDFAGHLDLLNQMDTLHKTVEYMRKHINARMGER